MESWLRWSSEVDAAWWSGGLCFLWMLVVGFQFFRLLQQADQQEIPCQPVPSPQKKAEEGAEDVLAIRQLKSSEWLHNLQLGLRKTREKWTEGLTGLFAGRRTLDAATLEALSEMLYRADIGVRTTASMIEYIRTHHREGGEISQAEIQTLLRNKTEAIFTQAQKPWNLPKEEGKPLVILVVGVNGVGKTTSIGKLAAHFLAEKKSVLLAAADTFRAAAIEQLQVWGQRLDVKVVAHQQGGDPAAVCFDGVQSALARKTDVLLLDTAGRLHNKGHLMEELGKIQRTIAKAMPDAPHEVWLVIDATTGQNAVMQVQAFQEIVPLSGLIVTKLDGTAKGGVLIGISDQFQLPIRFIGVGEKAIDLRPFQPEAFATSLFPSS